MLSLSKQNSPSDRQGRADRERFERRRRALDAIWGLNKQFLTVLCARAHSPGPFPFASDLRARFSTLTEADQDHLSRFGICLMDAGFRDAARWRYLSEHEPSYPGSPELFASPSNASWLQGNEGALLSQALYLLAWSLLQWDTNEARVLLGMTHETAQILSKIGVDRLVYVGHRCSHWIVPRWSELARAWDDLLSCGVAKDKFRGGAYGSSYGTLRMLTLYGGHLPALTNYLRLVSS